MHKGSARAHGLDTRSGPRLAEIGPKPAENPILCLANEVTFEDIGDEPLGKKPTECVANATSGPLGEDGFMRLVTYGSHPSGNDDIQEFQRPEAEAMITRFKAAANGLTRLLFKTSPNRPVFYGHPDHPAFAAQGHDDFTVRANITAMEARDDGLYIKPEFTDEGNELLAAGQKLWWSPRWLLSLHRREGTRRIWKPFKLISAGITPTPNILGSAANSLFPETETQPNSTMPEWIQKLLITLGFSEDQANATAAGETGAVDEDAVLVKANLLKDKANGYWDLEIAILRALGYSDDEINALRDDEAGAPSIDDIVAKLNERLQGAQTAADEANSTIEERDSTITQLEADLANERKARAVLVVENAIADSRVAQADLDKEVEALAAAENFEDAANAILQREKVLPSSDKLKDLGERKGEMQDVANARDTFNQAFADFANQKGYDLDKPELYRKAYAAFKATKEGKDLYAKMSHSAEE